MITYERRRLWGIVKSISKDEIKNNSITDLWNKYGYEFEYATFRKYLRACQK